MTSPGKMHLFFNSSRKRLTNSSNVSQFTDHKTLQCISVIFKAVESELISPQPF